MNDVKVPPGRRPPPGSSRPHSATKLKFGSVSDERVSAAHRHDDTVATRPSDRQTERTTFQDDSTGKNAGDGTGGASSSSGGTSQSGEGQPTRSSAAD